MGHGFQLPAQGERAIRLDPRLAPFAAEVDLDQDGHGQGLLCTLQPIRDGLSELHSVDGVDQTDPADEILDLIPLQVSDEVPLRWRRVLLECSSLVSELLCLALSEQKLAGRESFENPIRGDRL